MNVGRRWQRAAYPWRATLGTAVVATETEEHILRGAAAAIWELLDEPLAIEELVELAERDYGVGETDVRSALESLTSVHLCLIP